MVLDMDSSHWSSHGWDLCNANQWSETGKDLRVGQKSACQCTQQTVSYNC